MLQTSIVCATYKRFDHFRELVDSVRVSFPKGSYEIVAVSSDPVGSSKYDWMKSQPDVVTISAGVRNEGEHRSRSLYSYENIGLKHASGEWMFVTNDDTKIEHDFHTVLTQMEKEWDVIMVNGHLGDVGLGCRTAVIGDVTPPDGATRPLYLYDFTVIRRSVYERIGWLDEGLDWFGKGFDLAMACETANPPLRVCYSSSLRVNHSISPENRFPPHYVRDFRYATDKWNSWCAKNNWKYNWPW